MSKETQSYIKSAAAGVITGGLAFMAVKSITRSRRFRRKSAAKAFKVLGSFMDAI